MIISRSSLALRILVLLAVFAIAAGAAALLWWPCGCDRPPDATPNVTVTTPKAGIFVEEMHGGSLTLQQIAPGQRVAVIVMKGNWCRVCRDQLVRLKERREELRAANAVVVGMTTDPPAANAASAARLGLDFPILSDADGDAILSFGLDGANHPVPGVVFLRRDGTIDEIVRGRYPGQPQEDWILQRLSRP